MRRVALLREASCLQVVYVASSYQWIVEHGYELTLGEIRDLTWCRTVQALVRVNCAVLVPEFVFTTNPTVRFLILQSKIACYITSPGPVDVGNASWYDGKVLHQK